MKPATLFLGFAAVTVILSLAWLGGADPAHARQTSVIHVSGQLQVVERPSGVLVGTPRGQELEEALLAGLNARRAEYRIEPLVEDPDLVAVARERSADMVARNYFAHVTPEGGDVYMVLDARRITARLAGENLARNNWADAQSPSRAVTGFMASEPHRMNVLNPQFARAGVGVAIGPGGMKIYTVLFAGD